MKFKILLLSILIILFSAALVSAQGFFRTITHYYTHQGSYNTFSNISRDVAADNGTMVLIRTGDINVHILSAVATGGQTEIEFSEGVTVSNNGTELHTSNRYRASDKTPQTRVFADPNVTSKNKTLLNELVIGGTSNPSKVGGISRQREEFVLKKNTTYLVNATNTSGGPIDMNIRGSFYELNIGQ